MDYTENSTEKCKLALKFFTSAQLCSFKRNFCLFFKNGKRPAPGELLPENEIGMLQDELAALKQKVAKNTIAIDKVHSRQVRLEAHSRQKNQRFFGFDKSKIDAGKERDVFKNLLEKGFKVNDSKRVNGIMANLDVIHWTDNSKCLIVAFCRRNDIHFLKGQRKNLKGFKPHGSEISMEDDLPLEHQALKKHCLTKLHDMKRQEKFADAKYHSYNKIRVGTVVKDYDKWVIGEAPQ